jgi:VIT1/CCC1 family predicted Fe2+/Mn2+ transporter
MMKQLPTQSQQTSQQSASETVRAFHVSVQPKTLFGKLVAGIIGAAVMLAALFLSLLAFAIVLSIVLVAIVYFLWAAQRARRTVRNQTIEGEAHSRDIS